MKHILYLHEIDGVQKKEKEEHYLKKTKKKTLIEL